MDQRYILTIFFFCALLFRSQNNDSLEAQLKKDISDTIKLKILSDLSWNYATVDVVKAKKFATDELVLAQHKRNQKYMAQAYNDLGIVSMRNSNYKEALEFHKRAVAIRIKLKNDEDIASSYSKIATCSHELADYIGSYNAALKTLEIYERLNSKLYIAYTLNTICAVTVKMEQYDKVMSFAQRAYNLSLETGDKAAEGAALNYMAAAYIGEKNVEAAINKQQQALNVFTSIPDSNFMAAALSNLGYFTRMAAKDDKAIEYYKRALKIAENMNDINSIAMYNENLGSVYVDLKNYEIAQKHLEIAERLAKQQSMNDILMLVYRVYAELSIRTGKQDAAIDYIKKFAEIKDTLFSGETARQFSEMQVKYETEKKENSNQLLQKENELKTAEISKGRLTQFFLVSAIIFGSLIAYLLFVRTRLRQKQILDKELLKQQELRSKAVIEAEEKERVRIARELHDGIGQQLSAAKLNISGLQASIKTKQPEEILMLQNALELLDESVKEVRAVSHSMIPNALIKSGLVSAVREFINKISSLGNLRINLEIIGLNERLENTVENILFRVLQELVNNIIKHAKATEVGIQFIKHENELTILIEDNGVGFDVNASLSDINGGIGLKNISSRVAFLNGEVNFDSFPGKGTTVTIELPLPD